MRFILGITWVALSASAAENKLTPILGSRYDHGLVAKSDSGDSAITAREMLVDVTYTDERARTGALVVFFDSSSGRYLWEFSPALHPGQGPSIMTRSYGITGFLYKASDRLVGFGWGWTTLIIHESRTKASGIDDAEAKALSEATGALPKKLVHNTDDRVVIDTGKQLPRDFPLACPTCSGPAAMKVLEVIHKGNTWEITLQGQWKEKVILNEKYEVTGTARVN